jgi:hypothetical protein
METTTTTTTHNDTQHSNADIMKLICSKYVEAGVQWERLELPLFNKGYEELPEDMVERLYLHGRFEALSEIVKLLINADFGCHAGTSEEVK